VALLRNVLTVSLSVAAALAGCNAVLGIDGEYGDQGSTTDASAGGTSGSGGEAGQAQGGSNQADSGHGGTSEGGGAETGGTGGADSGADASETDVVWEAAFDAPTEDVTDGAVSDAQDGGALLPAVPLHTQSRWILDSNNQRFKMASVNWYGAESPDYVVGGLDIMPLQTLAHAIRQMGFNAVRLPWSNEMLEKNPLVTASYLSKNPALQGKHALEVFDEVIAALAKEGLLVILDNHVSRADWCCSDTDGNGLWYTQTYPQAAWIADWQTIVLRYQNQPAVVGADLRNEVRAAGTVTPVWGGGNAQTDWASAAELAGNAVLQSNSKLLIIVQGLGYSGDLGGAYARPIQLSTPNRLVYSPHDYAWYHTGEQAYGTLKTTLGNKWGFILVQGKPYTAPIFVGEFGTCNTSATCVADTSGQGLWFTSFRQYLLDADIDWSYWPLNGTESSGYSRTHGAVDTYGLLDAAWSGASRQDLLQVLQALQPATQFP
jgi:endoglucanase